MHLTARFAGFSNNPSRVIESTSAFWPIWTVLAPDDLEDQGQVSPYALPSGNIPRYTYKPKFGDSRCVLSKVIECTNGVYKRKVIECTDGQTGGRTDGPTQAMT